MSRRGRPAQGAKLVEHLEGSAEAKGRLRLILETLSGERSIPEACAALGVGESRFHELRSAWLREAAALLEPKPVGRPPTPAPGAAEQENAKLRAQLLELRIQLEAAEIREELALVMPHVLQRGRGAKKKGPACRDWKTSAPGGACGTGSSSPATGRSTT